MYSSSQRPYDEYTFDIYFPGKTFSTASSGLTDIRLDVFSVHPGGPRNDSIDLFLHSLRRRFTNISQLLGGLIEDFIDPLERSVKPLGDLRFVGNIVLEEQFICISL